MRYIVKKTALNTAPGHPPGWLAYAAIVIAGVCILASCGGSGGSGGDSLHLDDWETHAKSFNAVTTVDINGDGAADIVFTEFRLKAKVSCKNDGGELDCKTKARNEYFATVWLQNNLQPGTFHTSERYALSSNAYSVASGDFDLDGIPDLAIPQWRKDTVRLFSRYTLGSGGFLSHADFAAGNEPFCVAVGDLNGDGLHDIAIGGEDLVLLENNPTSPGKDFSPRSLGITDVSSVAIADIDIDNRNDLAVTSGDSVIILLQDPVPALPGNFTVNGTYAAGTDAEDIAIADLNNDSLPDLAVANRGIAAGSVSIHMQDPLDSGTFFPAVFYVTGLNSRAVAIGDLNNDLIPDLAIANNDNDGGSISVLLQDQLVPGVFLDTENYPGLDGPNDVAVADMDGDDLADLVVADNSSLPKGSPYIRFQDSNNPGAFSGRIELP